MQTMIKNSIFLIILISSSVGLAVAPYYSIRSQSENAARELVGAGWNTQINLCDQCDWYSNMALTVEFDRTFKPRKICDCLFGCATTSCATNCNTVCNECCDTDCCSFKVYGSAVADRSGAWLADNFGLPTDYKSVVCFEPQISNLLADFNFYFGLDQWVQGLYFRIHAPVCYTRWDLNMCERVENSGTNDALMGYYNSASVAIPTGIAGITRANLVSSFSSFAGGYGTIKADDITFTPLCAARMDCCPHTKTRISDIQMALGYNAWCDCDYHAGFNIRAAAPAGNRPTGRYLFEPIVGNGRHWELGAGFTSHYTFCCNECEGTSAAFYLDLNVTHMFKTKQCRTFDLCGKPLSRYMLAAKMGTPVEDLQAEVQVDPQILGTPNKQFKGIYSPVANLTTMAVDVSVGAQADLALMFQYTRCNWACDLGYEFWYRGCERIDCRCDCCPCFDDNTWVLKGDAFMYGFINATTAPVASALSASQSLATLCAGTNTDSTLTITYNDGVDNARISRNGSGTALQVFTPDQATVIGVQTSYNPVFIDTCDIDFCGAQTKARSHKLFAHVDYTWSDNECYLPYLGLGGQVEFGCKCCSDNCCDDCNSCIGPCTTPVNRCAPACNGCCAYDCCSCCAVSQWGLWLKGGFVY